MATDGPTSYELTVIDVVAETDDAKSIVFDVPQELREEFAYTPGQFLTLAIPSDQTGLAARCYSLSSSPLDPSPITVTVKRTADGYASNWINDNVAPGSVIRVLPPSGIFTPKDINADLLLFAGGSGITPVMSIARTALAKGSGNVTLLYANRDENSVIFAEALKELQHEHEDRFVVVHWLESVQGLPTQEILRTFAEQYAERTFFVCGPGPFMKAATSALKEMGIPRGRRHQEKFVSLGGNPFGDVAEVVEARAEVAAVDDPESRTDEPAETADNPQLAAGPVLLEMELDGETHQFDDWDPKQTLLEFLESKGVDAPFSCRLGECSACAFAITDGEVTMTNNDVLEDEDLEDGIRLGCQSHPLTEEVKGHY